MRYLILIFIFVSCSIINITDTEMLKRNYPDACIWQVGENEYVVSDSVLRFVEVWSCEIIPISRIIPYLDSTGVNYKTEKIGKYRIGKITYEVILKR